MTGIYCTEEGPGALIHEATTSSRAGTGRAPAAQSQATRWQPAVYRVGGLLRRWPRCDRFVPKCCGGRHGSRSRGWRR